MRLDDRLWTHVVRKVLPDADPAQLLAGTTEDAIERYKVMLAEPAQPLPVAQRAVEGVYRINAVLGRRRRARPGR